MVCTHPQQVLPSLQRVHEVLCVDVDHGVEHVEPLGQVLLHGVQILVSPGETPQLSLLYQLEGQRILLTMEGISEIIQTFSEGLIDKVGLVISYRCDSQSF